MKQITSKYPYSGAFDSRIGGRRENQDYCDAVDTPLGLLVVVCDGMGGGPGGATASYMSVEAIINTVLGSGKDADHEQVLRVAIENANIALRKKMIEVPALRGMGSTAVVLLIDAERAVIAHVGDSRAYKLKGRDKIFRTADHSYVGELVRNKTLTEEQARLSAQSNIITRAIGVAEKVEPDIDVVAYEKGDRFVICTDGIWGSMPEPQLIRTFAERKPANGLAEKIAMKVDQIGKGNGGTHDNLTIAIIDTKIDSKLKESMTKKAKLIILALAVLLVVCAIGFFSQLGDSSKIDDLQAQVENLQKENSDLNEQNGKMRSELDLANENADREASRANRAENRADRAESRADRAESRADRAETRADEAVEKANKKDNAEAKKEQKKATTQSALSAIISCLNSFKNLSNSSKADLGTSINSNKSAIVNKINALLDNQKYKNNSVLKSVRDAVKNKQWDRLMEQKNGKYVLNATAQNKITSLIEDLNKLK